MPATGSIHFGSFNAIEGAIGKYGLVLGEGAWTTPKGMQGTSNAAFQFSSTYRSTLGIGDPGASVNFTYLPIAPVYSGPHASKYDQSWATTANIQVAPCTLTPATNCFAHQHLHWPTAMNISLASGAPINWGGGLLGGSNYYSTLVFGQQLLDSKGQAIANISQQNPATTSSVENPCTSSPFSTCNHVVPLSSDVIGAPPPLDVGSLALVPSNTYTFKASFSSGVLPYSQSPWVSAATFRSATTTSTGANSSAQFWIYAPVLTLTQ